MKRIFAIIVTLFFVMGLKAQSNSKPYVINGDLSKYKYVYIVPTSGVTSNSGTSGALFGSSSGVFGSVSGGPIKTINPSEMMGGYFMKMGYTTLPSIMPEYAENTLVVSYGYLGRRPEGIFGYSTCIMIQMRDAKTMELMASYETEGYGEDETDDILEAVNKAMLMFQYSVNPKVGTDFMKVTSKKINLLLTNMTLTTIKKIDLRLTYYLEGELKHTQYATVSTKLSPNECIRKYIKRDKEARSKKYQIKLEVLSYQ